MQSDVDGGAEKKFRLQESLVLQNSSTAVLVDDDESFDTSAFISGCQVFSISSAAIALIFGSSCASLRIRKPTARMTASPPPPTSQQ